MLKDYYFVFLRQMILRAVFLYYIGSYVCTYLYVSKVACELEDQQ